MNIADRIQELRKIKGISQEELADGIGVSRQAVSKWETGQSEPNIEKIVLLSNYFDTTTDYLLKGIEPDRNTDKRQSAAVFAAAGTVLNAAGLIAAFSVWTERQTVYAVCIGIIVMLLGTGIFLTGQFIDVKDKKKAKYIFILPNIWILPFIPLSCGFNIVSGFIGGFSALPAPIPVPGNSLTAFALYWAVYIAVCIAADVVTAKKMKNLS